MSSDETPLKLRRYTLFAALRRYLETICVALTAASILQQPPGAGISSSLERRYGYRWCGIPRNPCGQDGFRDTLPRVDVQVVRGALIP